VKRCLVTGASGFLGGAVCRALAERWDVIGLGHRQGGAGIRQADLRDAGAVEELILRESPDAVVHLAAYRDPDFCESDAEEARRLNVDTTRNLCRALPDTVPLLYASTDYVFDGTAPPYHEEDAPTPLSIYGRTKLEGEQVVLERSRSLSLRFPVLVGAGDTLAGSGFIGQMIEAVRLREAVRLDDVHVRFPTWIRDVGEAIAWLLGREACGLYHFSGSEGATRYALTQWVAEILGCPSDHLSPAEGAESRAAARPLNSQLATDKLRKTGFTGFTPFAEVIRSVANAFP